MASVDTSYPSNLKDELEGSLGVSMETHEQSAGFFASRGTIAASASLLAKRYSNGKEDTIHILRLNKGPKGSRFRFPALFVSTVSKRLNALLEQVTNEGYNDWKLPGLDAISSYDELGEDQFWDDKSTIRVVQFHIRPFVTTYKTLMFRMWNAVDPSKQKVYDNDKGKVIWKGPVASLTVEETKRLATALEQLSKASPESE